MADNSLSGHAINRPPKIAGEEDGGSVDDVNAFTNDPPPEARPGIHVTGEGPGDLSLLDNIKPWDLGAKFEALGMRDVTDDQQPDETDPGQEE